jgi:hypothetical protein
MGQRAETLAQEFEQANREMISAVEGLSESQWQVLCTAEDWPVGLVAHHVGDDHALLSSAIQAVAIGLPMPSVTPELVDQMNSRHARKYAGCTMDETLQLLRKNGAGAAAILRLLTDEQLDKPAPHPFRGGEAWGSEDLVRDVMIVHIQNHLQSIRQAVAG